MLQQQNQSGSPTLGPMEQLGNIMMRSTMAQAARKAGGFIRIESEFIGTQKCDMPVDAQACEGGWRAGVADRDDGYVRRQSRQRLGQQRMER